MRWRITAVLVIVLVTATHFAGADPRQGHPEFGGGLIWFTAYEEACEAAQEHGRPIMIHYGRGACPRCRNLVQTMENTRDIHAILAGHFILLASDCDHPEREVSAIMRNVSGNDLPKVAYITHGGEFILGRSGGQSAEQLQADLMAVLRSNLLPASRNAERDLQRLARDAERAFDRERYGDVFEAWSDSQEIPGRSEHRDRIEELKNRVEGMFNDAMEPLFAQLRAGEFDAVEDAIGDVQRTFDGTPYEAGLDALEDSIELFRQAHEDPENADDIYLRIVRSAPNTIAEDFAWRLKNGDRPDPGADREKAPALMVRLTNDSGFDLHRHHGYVVIVDIWATWCGPCCREFPHFQRLYEEHREDGLIVLGLSVDTNSSTVTRWLQSNGISFPISVIGEDQAVKTDIYARWGEFVSGGRITGIPCTFFIDKRGRIARQATGAMREDALASIVEELLAE